MIRDCRKVKSSRDIYSLKGNILSNGLTDEKLEIIANQWYAAVQEFEKALQYQPGALSLNSVIYSSGKTEDITLEQVLIDENTECMDEEVENKMVVESFMNTL